MWNNNNSGGIPEASWEELLDSGQLDQQLNQQLSFTRPPPPHFHRPPQPHQPQPYQQPHHRQQQQQSSYHRYPQQQPQFGGPRFTQPPPPVMVFNRPPPRLPHFQQQQQQQQQQQYQQPRSNNYQPQQQQFSVMPRPKILQRPPQLKQQQQQPQCEVSVTSSEPEVTSTLTEDGIYTEYRPPDISKVKILKRPKSYPNRLSDQDSSSGKEKTTREKMVKSLKEREEEYAQARLRILGSAGHEDEEDVDEAEVDRGQQQQLHNNNAEKVKTVRAPRGPPTSSNEAAAKGFKNSKKKWYTFLTDYWLNCIHTQ